MRCLCLPSATLDGAMEESVLTKRSGSWSSSSTAASDEAAPTTVVQRIAPCGRRRRESGAVPRAIKRLSHRAAGKSRVVGRNPRWDDATLKQQQQQHRELSGHTSKNIVVRPSVEVQEGTLRFYSCG